MNHRPYQTIFPLDPSDIDRKAADEARVRDEHMITMIIGIFIGCAISSSMMLFGSWVLA